MGEGRREEKRGGLFTFFLANFRSFTFDFEWFFLYLLRCDEEEFGNGQLMVIGSELVVKSSQNIGQFWRNSDHFFGNFKWFLLSTALR